MAYVSLYRKYRSQRFEELLGQDHITAVLRNSIAQNRIAHAYLFCGPRGCGKTTTARLLARALNCLSGDAPTPDPCGTCSMCVRIREGHAIDVVEMDAASETGIDDVREKIIENARYAPAEARYKVYIIDEVHDLSQKAFDSLLKTIEEPPAHVVFVLATTEAHKVPLTIRSRCQRMDFKRGSLPDLEANLRRVAQAEGIQYEAEALVLIAKAAEGSFRDSLSLLEQVIAVADGTITADVVRRAIGAVTSDLLDAVIAAVRASDIRGIHEAATALLASGADARQILVALEEHLRDLMVVHYAGSSDHLPGVPSERANVLEEQSRWFQPVRLLSMLKVLADAERDLRFTNQHRLVVERALWLLLVSGEPAPSRSAAPAPIAVNVAPPAAAAGSPLAVPPTTVEPGSQEAEGSGPALASADEVTLEVLQRLWPRVRNSMLQRYRSAASVFTEQVRPVALDGNIVVLEFPTTFQRDRADRPEARRRIEEALQRELKLPGYTVRCILSDEATGARSGTASAQRDTPLLPARRPLLETVADELEAEQVEETAG